MTLNEKKAYKKILDLQRYHKNLSLIVFILKKMNGAFSAHEKQMRNSPNFPSRKNDAVFYIFD